MPKKRAKPKPKASQYNWIASDLRPLAAPLGTLHTDPNNARTHDADNLTAIEASLKQFGQVSPIVANSRNNDVVIGNGRFRVARDRLGWSHIAVIWRELSETQQRALSVADNRTAELADWDLDLLEAELAQIETDDGDLYADLLLAELRLEEPAAEIEEVEPQIDRAAELQKKWKTETGQLWVIPSVKGKGEHRVLCGDSTKVEDVERVMGGEKVELCLTDPPYGIDWDTNYSRFSRGTTDKPAVANDNQPFDPRVVASFPTAILWGANHYGAALPPASWLVWDKRNTDGTAFLADAEVAWWNKGHGVYLKSISAQQHRSTAGGLHPTQKPVSLMAWCIEKAGGEGIILDPFLGSGTTLIAAEQLGRLAYGLEISPAYVAVILERLTDLGLTPGLSK